MKNLFTKNVITPCIPVEKTGGLSSDVREMGNVRYEQKAAHAINQVLKEPERLQSVREWVRTCIRSTSRLIAVQHC